MNYKDDFLTLESRLQKKENEERYHNLILHTSDVEDGERLYSLISRAYYIVKITEKYCGNDKDFLIAQFHTIFRIITELLDKHGWV